MPSPTRHAAGLLAALLPTALAAAQNGLPAAIDGAEFAARRQHWAWLPLAEVAPPTADGDPIELIADEDAANRLKRALQNHDFYFVNPRDSAP